MVIYGIHPVLEALRVGAVERVAVLESRLDDRRQVSGSGTRADRRSRGGASRVDEVVRLATEGGVAVVELAGEELARLSAYGVHQGVVAWTRERRSWTPTSLVKEALGTPLLVVLDGIEDPHNLGAILRTAHAAGADGVVRQTRRAAPLSGAVAKASAGAMLHARIADVVNVARAVDELKGLGVWTVALDAEGTSAYDQIDLTLPTALVVGAEGEGVRRLVKAKCDFVARIPMSGRLASLNASVAAAIVLFEAVRQRGAAGAAQRSRGGTSRSSGVRAEEAV